MKSAFAFLLVIMAAHPAGAAEKAPPRKAACVKVDLLDQNGLAMVGQSTVGLTVGQRTIIPEASPAHWGLRPGMATPCPDALVESVAESYKQSCLTGVRRAQTAQDNNVSRESVDTQCQMIQDSLGESLAAYLKWRADHDGRAAAHPLQLLHPARWKLDLHTPIPEVCAAGARPVWGGFPECSTARIS